MSNLRRIFAEIETERQCQDVKHGGSEIDDGHTGNDWIAIIVRHLGLAANDKAAFELVRYRKQLIRVAATCFAAVEALDRLTGNDSDIAGPTEEQRGPGY